MQGTRPSRGVVVAWGLSFNPSLQGGVKTGEPCAQSPFLFFPIQENAFLANVLLHEGERGLSQPPARVGSRLSPFLFRVALLLPPPLCRVPYSHAGCICVCVLPLIFKHPTHAHTCNTFAPDANTKPSQGRGTYILQQREKRHEKGRERKGCHRAISTPNASGSWGVRAQPKLRTAP